MNVMRNFTLRNLSRNKKRTIVTIIGVIISVAMITATTTLLFSFVNYMQQGAIADGGEWHAQLLDVPAEKLDIVTESNEVDVAVLSREVGYAQLPDSENYSKSYLYLREYSANGFEQMSIRLAEGRLPQSSGEVLISKSMREGSDVNYQIGAMVTLDMGDIIDTDGAPLENNGYLSDAYNEAGEVIASPTFALREPVTLTVVGIMETPGFESSWSAGYGLLGYLDSGALAPADPVDVYITVPHLSRDIYDDVSRLTASIGNETTGAEFNDQLLRYYGVVEWDNVYAFLQGFMLVIILIIVIASVSLIYNAFAMSVSERARQLGLLASVGATRRQKRTSVYFEGFFVGVIGIPAGILAGIGGIGITLAAIQPLLDSFINMDAGVKLTLIVPPAAIAITVLFSVITIFVSVYRPARRASKIMPIDAIRQAQEVRLTRRNVKTSRFTRKLFGFEAEIALKNLKRSRKKYRATVVSLVISLVLFLTVSSYASITRNISGATSDGYNYDISVQYSKLSQTQRDDTNARIAALELVDDFTVTSRLSGFVPMREDQLSPLKRELMGEYGDGVQALDFFVAVVGLDDEKFAAYADTVGVRAAEYADTGSPKAILINYGQDYVHTEGNNAKKIAGEVLNVRAGETLSLTAGDPGLETSYDAEAALTVGAVTKERPMGVLIGGFHSVTLVVTDDVWNSIIGSMTAERRTELAEQGALQYAAYMTAEEDQRLEARLNELTQGLPASGSYLYNIKDMARNEQNLSTFLGVFVYGFIILISLICTANIFNTVSTNIGLRRREFAMLRSVGMTPNGFNKMMRFESVFYGLKGLLYGLPISLAIGLLLYRMQIDVLGGTFSIPWVSYSFAVLMILVIVSSTMLYSTHRIKKENIIDALKDETF